MFEPVAIVTKEYEAMIEQIRRPHIQAAWSVLSQHAGHESAISRKDYVAQLRAAIGQPRYCDRSARKLVGIIRAAGIPVCADRHGYWIGTPTETLEWAAWYRAHAFSMLNIARRLVGGALRLTLHPDVRGQANKMAQELQTTLDLEQDGDNGQETDSAPH